MPSSLLSYFVLTAGVGNSATEQLTLISNFYSKTTPQNLMGTWNPLDVFFLNDNKGLYRALGKLSNAALSALEYSTFNHLQGESTAYNYEVVFNSTSLDYNYVGTGLSLLFFAVFYFFVFLVFFTALLPLPQQLYPSEVFLLSLDSSYGFIESEKEVGSMDDVLLPAVCTLVASVAWFYLLLPFQVLNTLNSYLDGLFLLFFCCLIVSLPVNLLYECGVFFSTFFRGSAGSTSTIMELLYDLIANTTMFARMQVQHVRVLLGLAMYMETANYIESLSIQQLISPTTATAYVQYSTVSEHFTSSGLSFVSDLILQVSTLIAELGHYIVFLLQSSASYAALIFWLFSLLYSGFFKETVEGYFAIKESLRN